MPAPPGRASRAPHGGGSGSSEGSREGSAHARRRRLAPRRTLVASQQAGQQSPSF
ncbi:unnamed protein product, partial [Polarella glacialis]